LLLFSLFDPVRQASDAAVALPPETPEY
jgi:hypothetical protein